MAKKKISRKQLLKTEDEFLTFSARLLQFVIKYKLQISYVLGGVCVILIVFSGIHYFSIKSENKAFEQMAQSMVNYQKALAEDESVKTHKTFQTEFQLISNNYSGTKGGKLASVIYANICYNTGDFDKAIHLYQLALKDFEDDFSLKDFILSGLAYSHEGKKDYPSAIKFFEDIVSSPDAILKEEALFSLGRIYAETGNSEKSQKSYNKIVSEFSDSIYYKLSKEKISG